MIQKAHRLHGLRVCGPSAIITLVLVVGSTSLAKEHPPIPAFPTTAASDKNSAATGSACLACHQEKLNQPVKHPAVELAGCEGCHQASQKDGKWSVKLVAEGNQLCFLCHDNKKPQTKAGVRSHPPAIEGECLGCHDPHGSKQKFMLQGTVELDQDNLCFTCHGNIEELTKKKTVHGALQMGCLTCHETHKSGPAEEQQFGFHLVKGAPSLCLECHDGKDASLIKTHAGQPFQTATCTGCHNPHGSDNAKLIRANVHPPFAEKQCDACHEEPKNGKVSLIEQGKKELCFTCHPDKEELLSKAKVKHGYFEIDDTCTTCHSPHATDQPKWLKQPVRALCGTCHQEEAAGKAIEHRPLQTAESCAICHEPHASEFRVHLRANVNNLCLTCHGAILPKAKEGLVTLFDKIVLPASLFEGIRTLPVSPAASGGHPIMQHPFSGRNKLAPELGDLSCASCHDPKGVSQDMNKKLLATEGNRASDLCLTCHGGGNKAEKVVEGKR